MRQGEPPRARVTIESRRLWAVRASLAATRWLLYAAAAAGIAATVRDAVAPARAAPSRPPSPAPASAGRVAAAEWFALRFARAYLGWTSDGLGRERSLAPFLTAATDPGAGLEPAPRSSEAVAWAAIAGARAAGGGAIDCTVAVATASGAVRYLTLAVGPAAGGAMTLLRYPALVAAPEPAPAARLDGGGLPVLADPALAAVLARALRNYVSDSEQNLAADLAPGAAVEAVAPGLRLRAIVRLAVAGPRSVLATLVAVDGGGTAYTLAYEVGVEQAAGRWEITHITS